MSAPVFRLKGSGWYETDFKGDKENKRNLAGADKEEPKSEAKVGRQGRREGRREAGSREARGRQRRRKERAGQARGGEGEPRRQQVCGEARQTQGQTRARRRADNPSP